MNSLGQSITSCSSHSIGLVIVCLGHQKIISMMYSVAELVVDATDDDDFQMKFDALIVSWRNHSVSSSADLEGFIEWFTKKTSAV